MTEAQELAQLRLTVAKVRDIYDALRERQEPPINASDHILAATVACRIIANAIEDALIDASYEAALGETEEVG